MSVVPVQFRMPPYLDVQNLNIKNIHGLKKRWKDYTQVQNYIFMGLCIVDQI